ncbi:ferric reductase NAD binding domain-containing protein [Trichophaea hybrida]|nr:ferric reductase NAD binding domain-containing protein [Trichophaea hybrida]
MTPEQCAWKARKLVDWYHADWNYALTSVYFVLGFIALFGVVRLLSMAAQRPATREKLRNSNIGKRTLAGWRYLSYRAYHVPAFSWYSPPLGVMLVGVIGIVFFMVMTLAARPYYWPNKKVPAVTFGSSPPIATRAGWMATALLPFMIAFASKWNFVTFVTGVTHEKLQVFHRWTSWAMFILALVHTFPFIVYHIWKGDMMSQYKTTIWYWSGVATLIPQAWLTFMSIGPIRNRYYEFFKSTHYAASTVFIVFFFLHCNFRLSSWDYFIATAIIYVLSLLASFGNTYLRNGTSHRATLQILKGDMIGVTIPTKISWHPSQHVFVRFCTAGINSFSAHPFTISSTPSQDPGSSEIKFYILPHGGITGRLRALAEGRGGQEIPVVLEGPYGGLRTAFGSFRKVLVIVGGSGGSLVTPLVEDFVRRLEGVEVHVVWMVRTRDAIEWFEDDLVRLQSQAPDGNVKVSIYVTRDIRAGEGSTDSSEAEREKDILSDVKGQHHSGELDVHVVGRPDLSTLIKNESESVDSMAIAACGPSSLLLDVQNTAAALQLDILHGKSSLSEVYLHTEHFS